ncbi:NUDIX hydrolase [Flexivirga endophytica]|uniref:NUDIX hydrolase n=1 Tax=Flexivirga endophytica TaxID=1849103 RepID=A0A916X109_9MICO|nr:NUDIX domain-containing protein [Flexivirga endophytica]GGB45666.1 NUDIX hydrolase [Flexivirga endophytica]GHB66371.1 NUDIX hydrolase [Flexivirga endophytica]
MSIPEYIAGLREKIGTDLIWMPGASAYILRDGAEGPQVLLVRRSDNGRWTPVTGICDPGEEPDTTAQREALEEAMVEITVERLLAVTALRPIAYDNGDRCQYLDHAFRCRWVSGEARVGDEESSDVRWFGVDDLPPLLPRFEKQLAMALADDAPVLFGAAARER